MRAVFLGYTFRDEEKELVTGIEHLLASHGLGMVRGRYLDGQPLLPAVQQRIEVSDALIGLLTKREQIVGGGWSTHPWVLQELAISRTAKRRTVAIVEEDVKNIGAESGFEFLPLNRHNLLATFIDLAEIIGTWKRDAGRTVKVQVLPDEVAAEVGHKDRLFQCTYRLVRAGTFGVWQPATPVRAPGATFLFLDGVTDDDSVQISIESADGRRQWTSDVQSQWMDMRLREVR